MKANKPRSTSRDCTWFTCFETHINYFPDNLWSTCKLYTNDVSLFSNFLTKTLNEELNENWHKISNWKCKLTSNWKKNAKRNYFRKSSHPVTLNYTEVITFPSWKYIERILDEWLSFTECIDSKVSKCDKLIKKELSKSCFLRIYKSFIRSQSTIHLKVQSYKLKKHW